jgi:hypothetical protein
MTSLATLKGWCDERNAKVIYGYFESAYINNYNRRTQQHDNYIPYIDIETIFNELAKHCIGTNNLYILDNILDAISRNNSRNPIYFNDTIYHNMNDINVVKILFKYKNIFKYDAYLNYFNMCCRDEKYLEIAKYIHDNVGDIKLQYDSSFSAACYGNQLHIAQWLCTLETSENWKNNVDFKALLQESCCTNRLQMAKWLYSLNTPEYWKSKEIIKSVFISICKQGYYLEIAQWLYTLDTIDIHEDNDSLFKSISHINIARWLYDLDGIINITETYNYSCVYAIVKLEYDLATKEQQIKQLEEKTKIIPDLLQIISKLTERLDRIENPVVSNKLYTFDM